MNIGYIRVSSKTQNPERQIIKMKELGIEDRFLFIDYASGKDFDRPAWQAMQQVLRPGDVLHIDSLDRLSRNYEGIINEWRRLTQSGVDIVALDKADIFDNRIFRAQGDVGKLLEDLFLSTLAFVAQTERTKIKQRQREGIEIAQKAGKYNGRPRVKFNEELFIQLYEKWLNREITTAAYMRALGLKSQTFYRRLREYEAKKRSTD